MKRKEIKTATSFMRIREMGLCASMPRNDYKLFSNLLLSEKRIFRKNQEYFSSSPVFFEADRLYVNHYRRAYSVVKRNTIYDLDRSLFRNNVKERITDADIFYLTSASRPGDILCSELFVGLTDSHRLLLMDARTGSLLKTFQLPPREQGYRFTELGIGKDNETLFVKGRRLSLPPSKQPHFVFAIFNLAPFRFHSMFLLNEKDIGPFVNVTISQDLLIVVHGGSLMKFYSLEDILRPADTAESDQGEGTSAAVEPDTIIRPNLTIDWPRPCLHSIRVTSEGLELGGFPWHCLYKPPKQFTYRLQSIATGESVKLDAGQLHQTDPGQGMEVNVFFNPDESGSIIYVLENHIKKFVMAKDGDELCLKEAWSVELAKTLSEDEDIMYTASGRKACRSAWKCNDGLQYIHCVQYSSSMDALCAIVYYETPADDEQDFESWRFDQSDFGGGKAKMIIVDNRHGRIKKEILLDEPWDNACEEHHVELDDDVLVHSIKHRSGKHSCHVYRLTEIIEKDQVPVSSTSKRKYGRSSDESGNRRSSNRRRKETREDNDKSDVSTNVYSLRPRKSSI